MHPDFWHERWRSGRIGFHQATVDGNLLRHWPSLGVPEGSRVLVPLCGKSLDLRWLLERRLTVIGADLSDLALQAFCMENGIAARRRSAAGADVYEAPGLELHRRDFLTLSRSLLGEVAAVYDRAALVSWTPAMRAPYVEHLEAITPPGTVTLLVTLEYDQSQSPGPPFSVDAREVHRLYAPGHAIEELERRDVLAAEPRMRARGVTALAEVCYRMERR